jgi:hypothetical protein
VVRRFSGYVQRAAIRGCQGILWQPPQEQPADAAVPYDAVNGLG